MKLYCSLPHPNEKRHKLVVATGDEAIDHSDVTLATISRFEEQFLRTAQVSARVEESRLLIQHLQGAGPLYSYRRAGAGDPKKLFDQFQEDVGLKPINTLLTTLVLEAKEQGLEEAVWEGNNLYPLKPDAILYATRFRRDASGLFRLPLNTPDDKIIKRLVACSTEKLRTFEVIRERFRELLPPLYDHPSLLKAVGS